MPALTCISCHVAFSSILLHREHYKSDWHRYNLMRKIAELPPITHETFEIRAAYQKEKLTGPEPESGSYCTTCRKYFRSQNALTNHFQSKKHLETETKAKSKAPIHVKLPQKITPQIKNDKTEIQPMEEIEIESETSDSDWESVDDENETIEDGDNILEQYFDGEALPENRCLFCPQISTDADSNLDHMTSNHSFFIPDVEFLTDLKGLMNYLSRKVGAGRMCLWCTKLGGRRFRNVLSVQQHMTDKGHCKMLQEGEALLEYAPFYDYSTSYPDQEVENDPDQEVDISTLEGDDWQLVLPSGATIGHRSLRHYFKQNVRPNQIEGKKNTQHMIHHLMTKYRALGWQGISGQVAKKKAKDFNYVKRIRDKHYMKLGVKANKFQPHFRMQVMF